MVGYDDSCLAAIRHVKSIIRVVQPRPNIRSHSVLLLFNLARRQCYAYGIGLFTITETKS